MIYIYSHYQDYILIYEYISIFLSLSIHYVRIHLFLVITIASPHVGISTRICLFDISLYTLATLVFVGIALRILLYKSRCGECI